MVCCFVCGAGLFEFARSSNLAGGVYAPSRSLGTIGDPRRSVLSWFSWFANGDIQLYNPRSAVSYTFPRDSENEFVIGPTVQRRSAAGAAFK